MLAFFTCTKKGQNIFVLWHTTCSDAAAEGTGERESGSPGRHTNISKSGCVLCPPCTRQAPKAPINIPPQSLEPLLLSRTCGRALPPVLPVQGGWTGLGPQLPGPHLLPDQLASHQFLIYRRRQNNVPESMMYEHGES